jgi:hypothetical protein
MLTLMFMAGRTTNNPRYQARSVAPCLGTWYVSSFPVSSNPRSLALISFSELNFNDLHPTYYLLLLLESCVPRNGGKKRTL